MIKTIISGSFNFDDAMASIVPLYKSAVDRSWLTKRAAAEPLFDFDKLEAKPGETLVHLLALGDGEVTGANRNGDYFPKAANEKYHHTFKKAMFYRHHENDDTKKSYGRVVSAAYNPRMGRVELVIGMDNNKCSEELDLLEKKGEFPVSMSCFVDPNTLVRTMDGYVPLSSVKVGDLVPTHTGKWKKVTEVIKRKYSGGIIDFKVRGYGGSFSVTEDHPFQVINPVYFETYRNADKIDTWTHAKHIEVGSLLCLKQPSDNSLSLTNLSLNNDSTTRYTELFSGVWVSTVTDVSYREVSDIDVYNLEVEDDHSYIAAGLNSHNCKVPYDVCSICNNKAKTRQEYCKHASAAMGQILDDGRQVYVVNDHPDFFDISRVRKPADRVAYTFRKVASDNSVIGGAELAEMLEIAVPIGVRSAYGYEKKATLSRMRNSSDNTVFPLQSAVQLAPLPKEYVEIFKNAADKDALFSALNSAGICLPVSDFAAITGLDKPATVKDSDIRKRVHGFLTSTDEDLVEKICENGKYDGVPRKTTEKAASAISTIKPTHSLLPDAAYSRIMQKVASEGLKPAVKSAAKVGHEVDNLAAEYAAYLVSLAHSARKSGCANDMSLVENLTAMYVMN